MAQRWTVEIRVGLFIISAVFLLVLFVFAIGDLSRFFQAGNRLRVVFDTANGITEGSPVQYAGVEVGKVQAVNIKYLPERRSPVVELVVWLPATVTVRADDVASISTFGLLGEKYLDLTPGQGQGPALKDNQQLFGKPPVSTEKIIERSNEVLTQLQQTLEGINTLVGDPEARLYLKEAIMEARDATRNWKALGERLNLAMSYAESGQGSLGRLLFDDELYQRMVTFVDDLRAHPWKLLVRTKEKKQPATSGQPRP
jgi:phospholipid/cholesterol/gamma-HCH transport system substrate-binding protein